MAHFPLFVSLENRPCLIVGGGQVALRRAQTLCAYGATVTVVAPEIADGFSSLPHLSCLCRPFAAEDINGNALVLAATNDRTLNHLIGELCHTAGVPFNAADCPQESDFLFPSTIQRGELSVGISSGGSSPLLVKEVRQRIESVLPPETADLTTLLSGYRTRILADLSDRTASERAAVFAALFDACMQKGRGLSEAEYQALLSSHTPQGKVFLVGAGCGGPEWLTLGGAERLRRCDAVVYDALLSPDILSLVPATAERFPVGKRAGLPSPTQEEINLLLVQLAQQGKNVVRLKGGDPFVFGRGGEEVEALQAEDIPFEVIPGVSSCIAIPEQAGIPVTHRRVSRSFTVVTAHTATHELPENLSALAELNGTLVFLMGLSALPRLVTALMNAGKDPLTPVAVLSGGNSPHPVSVRATLSTIVQAVQKAGVLPPAIIVVGKTADLDFSPLSHKIIPSDHRKD